MITKEMEEWFEKRTMRHIALVGKYIKKLRLLGYDLPGVESRHDLSKLEEPEKTPYIYISWMYKEKAEGREFIIPEEVNSDEATLHHILNNSHHPEFHQEEKVGLLNRKDRDGLPAKIIDATKMPIMDIAEMVCDWAAMAEEKGTSAKNWADKVINKRWKFTEDQVKLIYNLICECEKEEV